VNNLIEGFLSNYYTFKSFNSLGLILAIHNDQMIEGYYL